MKASAFSTLSPGKLVPTIEGALAFVPNSLRRELPPDSRTTALLGQAEFMLGRLGGTAGKAVNPFLIGAPLLRREAILSSRIEGTITTPEQLTLFEVGEPAQDEDTKEVLNYVSAMVKGLELVRDIPICVRLMKEIHAVLLEDVRGGRERPGELRATQNWIREGSDSIHEARFVPPPPQLILDLLADLERFANETSEDIPPLIRAALIHYQFEAIHPFRDGNGRIGRLLIPLYLCTAKKLPAPLLYLSSYFERNRDAYTDSLLRVSQIGDFQSWFHFFLRGVAECAEESCVQVEQMLALREDLRARFQTARSSALLIKLIDHLFRSPSVTIGAVTKVLGITPAAAKHNIDKLISIGLLEEVTQRKKNKIFLSRPILAFMRDRPMDNPPSSEDPV